MSTSYQIRIRGHIDLEWADFFSSLEIRHQPDGTTYLTGALADQSELQGVLDRIHSLGLQLLLVEKME